MGLAAGRLGHSPSWLGLAASRMGWTPARIRRAAAWLGWSATGLGDASRLGIAATGLEPGVHPGAGRIRPLPLHGGG
jgi:hypothetical protein